MDLTTLQLAERLALAVIRAVQVHHPYGREPARALLRELRETSHWFVHVVQDADGVIDGTAPVTQMELFDDESL